MNDSKIPVRYAKALFELAVEKSLTDKICNNILLVQEVVQMQEIKDLLTSPIVTSLQKKKMFKAILEEKVDALMLSFIDMVVKNKRETYLDGIARYFIRLYKIEKNIKSVELTTAVEIDSAQKEAFKNQVLKSYKAEIELIAKVNPEIVGGFVLQVDDLLYDASVKRQLRNIQNTLVKEKI